MRILFVHNSYAKPSGEEHMINRIMGLLRSHNHEVDFYFENSSKIKENLADKCVAFIRGFYSIESRKSIINAIHGFKPDIVQIQNLYPLISPSILSEINNEGIPIVMRLANYRLACPNGLLLSRGQLCTKCAGGREWWCVFNNCENDIFKSFGYAARNFVARIFQLYRKNVTAYYAQTEFQRNFLINEGISNKLFDVIPNMVDPLNHNSFGIGIGSKVVFAGRLSPEKGIASYFKTASKFPAIPFSMAGDFSRMSEVLSNAPPNVELLGHLDKKGLEHFYSNARFIVVPSIWYEGFPSVIIEAMLHNKPVICSRIGGLPEIVDEGETGLLFEPGNVKDLTSKIRLLYQDPELCLKMGKAGREKVLNEYSPDKYYERLMNIYQKAIKINQTASL
jgi:glycosyltransferase involved in cell wall biosynthesis